MPPCSAARWDCCRWTGTYQGVGETFARTPACAQLMARDPSEGEFLHTVKLLPEANQKHDACNEDCQAENRKDFGNMWPLLQQQGETGASG